MFQANVVQNMIRGLDPIHAKSVQFRPGQVFQGTITQLYPGQLAQLQMGNMQLSAHLEAQLEKGRQYWFRVQSSGEGIPRLKVLENVSAQPRETGAQPQNLQQVLQQLGLPSGGNHERLLQHLSQQNLPFSRANLAAGAELMQQSQLPAREAMAIIQQMMQQGLPMTRDVFSAMSAMQQPQSFAGAAEALQQQLGQLPVNQGNTAQLQQLLGQFLQQSDPMGMTPNGQGGSQAPRLTGVFYGVLQQVQGGNPALQEQALSVLRDMGLIRTGEGAQQLMDQFKANILRPENQAMVRALWPQLFSGNQTGMPLAQMSSQQVFNMLMGQVQLNQPGALGSLVQLLGDGQPQGAAQGQGNVPLQAVDTLDRWLHTQPSATQQLLSAVTEGRPQQFMMAGSQDAAMLRQFLQQMGLQHEQQITQQLDRGQMNSSQLDTLKGQLMQFLQQNPTLPQGVQQQAEFMLSRLTGFQLMSMDQKGPMQHLLFQVPVKMGDSFTDMTLQWDGRKKADGTIDENHCRILFYLHLASLDETVIDVQIQKRVVSITVYNDEAKPAAFDLLQPVLGSKLKEKEYHLSSVKWQQPEEDEPVKLKQPPGESVWRNHDDRGYRGLDVRI
ncbi:hypothetical protein [Salisediminibacterium selenitireducens]|uniref:Flagellar hook-length control protein-like C-terminal domain-containing protein n=1 Tax=Bacillus selenitireducens (strain ATCC 700615 / DSM 15326 / MLS10) TaxID=439292 RepID=D6XTV0_BACIE|nr:hypothetical protein [Salisediminibacterium selenitireducens]ADH99236.1 hypothetical protein Bsel_1728 [[Bacillus] selenitireducens MLS10]